MEELIKYPEEDHEYIINGGIVIYNYQKKCGKRGITVDDLEKKVVESKMLMLEKEKNADLGIKLIELTETNDENKKKLYELEKEHLNKEYEIKNMLYKDYNDKIRKREEEIVKKEEEKYNYLKNELNLEREARKNEIKRIQEWLNTEKSNNEYLKKRYDMDLNKELENQTKCYKEEIDELRKKNEDYFNKYENKNKGKIFEEDFFRKVEEYNDKEEGNKWNISHVGSKYGGMCDIIFQHKDTSQTILVESKNNLQKNPVPTKDVDKFYRDVLNDTNNAIGGIIVSTSKIQKKRSYEREVIQNKICIFLSHFSLDNIGQLFCNLEYILGENKINNDELNKEQRNELLIKQFDYYVEEGNFHKTRSKKAYDKSEEIREIYFKLNQEDIKILKNNEKKTEKVKNVKKKTEKVKKGEKKEENTIIAVNYEQLEENCNIVKKIKNEKQTKFYLKYENNEGEIILQYFSDNYKVEKKMEKMKKDGKNIIKHSEIKKRKKKEENETIIKITTQN